MYKLVSYGKNMLVVENLETKKRIPAYTRDRVVALGDIAIYTTEEEVPLARVLEAIRDKYEAKAVDMALCKTDAQLDEFFAQVLPNYDQERVHKSDMHKLIQWYNILIGNGITDFAKKEEEKTEAQPESEA